MKGSESALPVNTKHHPNGYEPSTGMTLRDYAAIAVAPTITTAILSLPPSVNIGDADNSGERIATIAYEIADAFLEVRSR